MIRHLAILSVFWLACCGAEAQQTNDQIRLRATVQDVVALPGFAGTVIPVDADPNFALTMRIESVTPADTNFAAGSKVTFAIHSPSKLFMGEDAKGKTYDFSVRRMTEQGKTRYFQLEIRKEKADKAVATRDPDPESRPRSLRRSP
jgi:hypothetical protein